MTKDQSKWLSRVLTEHSAVESTEILGRGLVKIHRKDMPHVIVGVLSADPVNLADIESILTDEFAIEMIVNIPNRASWAGRAIEALEAEGIAFGKMGDLYRALNREYDLSNYRNPEFGFVERLIDQHQNVRSRERVSDRVYRISGSGGAKLIVVLSQAYEVTADVIRTAYENHGQFDILFKTNPFGRISTQAREAADKINVRVGDASGFHQALSNI